MAEVVRRHRVTVGHERDVAAGGLPPALDHGRYPLREVAVPLVVLVPHSGPHQVDSVEGVGGVYAPRAVGVVVAGLVELLGEVRGVARLAEVDQSLAEAGFGKRRVAEVRVDYVGRCQHPPGLEAQSI